ncbi:MAG: DUF4399 domain-containing protein [Hyphomicrobiales bacterium]|nr:DUF4399 domain-containing protein [Hyphomicrobiales bacterium]
MTLVRLLVLSTLAVAFAFARPGDALAQGTSAPKDATLYFIWPLDGATLKGPFWCRFGLRNMGVTHAGDEFANSGHHHLLIDVNEVLDTHEPIPQDKSHLHFGAGQTETRLELTPGKHTLQLVLGDAKHFPFNPPLVSRKITITVK